MLVLGIFVAIAAIYVAFLRTSNPLSGLETQTLIRRNIETTVTALGQIEPRNYVDVGAQVSGQLTHILVQPGNQVTQGELLAEIDPQVPAAKVAADKADLARLKASLAGTEAQSDYAAEEFRRQVRLRHDNATREDAFELARSNMRAAAANVDEVKAQIEEAQFTLEADEAQLGYTRIYAPMAGTVVSVEARQGQTINAAYATPVLLRIADLSTMTVWTQVSEADVTALHAGMPLYFTTLGYGDRRWTGTLRQILPTPVNPQTANAPASTAQQTTQPTPGQPGTQNVVLYTALFDVANPKGDLRPEMTAQVFFITASAKDALTLPMTALTPKDATANIYTVQVVKDGRLETRTVRIGVHTRFTAQVLSGLAAGETVVTGRKPGSDSPSLIEFRW